MRSFEIGLTAFRQILFLPLTLSQAEDVEVSIAEDVTKIADDLGKEGSEWTEILDHLAYLGRSSDKFAYAEFVYFHAYIQQFLYDRRDKPERRPMRLYERKNRGRFKVGVDMAASALGAEGDRAIRVEADLPVERMHLYLSETGVAILVVEVALERRPSVLVAGAALPMSLAHAQAIQNALRRIYPPYFFDENFDSVKPTPIPQYPTLLKWSEAPEVGSFSPVGWIAAVDINRTNPLDPLWDRLLRPLTVETSATEKSRRWRQIIDERMPSMVMLGVADVALIEPSDFSRLCFMDEPGEGYFYSEKFLEGYEKTCFYDRFWEETKGTRYMFSGYSMIVVGGCGAGDGFDFFRDVLGQHFRRHYFQIGLLIQMQFAALPSVSHRVSKATFGRDRLPAERADDWFREKMQTLEGEFLTFEQRYWFTQISNQLQARELYAKWLERTGVKEIYDEARAQVQAANDYLDSLAQQRQAAAAERLSIVATWGVLVGLALAFLGMNVLATPDFLAVFGVMKGLNDSATPMIGPGPAPLVASHAAVFLIVLAAFLAIGAVLLRLDPRRAAASKGASGAASLLPRHLMRACFGAFALAIVALAIALLRR